MIWAHNLYGFEDIPNWITGRVHANNIFDGSHRGSFKDTYYRYLNIGLHVPFSTGTDWFIYDFSRVYVQTDRPLTPTAWLEILAAGKSRSPTDRSWSLGRRQAHRQRAGNGGAADSSHPRAGRSAGQTSSGSSWCETAAWHTTAKAGPRAATSWPTLAGRRRRRAGLAGPANGAAAGRRRRRSCESRSWRTNSAAELFAHTSPIYLRSRRPRRVRPPNGPGLRDEMRAACRPIEPRPNSPTKSQRRARAGVYDASHRDPGEATGGPPREAGKNKVLHCQLPRVFAGGIVHVHFVDNSNLNSATPNCDVVIRGGQVFDGTGSPGVAADVAIDGGKVQADRTRVAAAGAPRSGRRGLLGDARHARHPHALRCRDRGHARAGGVSAARRHDRGDGQLLAVGGAGNEEGPARPVLPRRKLAARGARQLAGRQAHLERRARVLTTTSKRCRWAPTWPA